jgi:taurine dioxygenase
MKIEPTGAILGARVTDVDLREPLSRHDFGRVLLGLADHGVLCFSGQQIDAAQLKAFSGWFGTLQSLSVLPHEQGMPEVSILSNIVENGKLIGIPDAGQDWHTDMTYNEIPGFVNVLMAYAVPMRDGKPLGGTEFTNTRAAYDGLPADFKTRLADATAQHEFAKFSDMMRIKKGSTRPPIPESVRRARPPVHHPVFLTHPISGKKVLYVNPGFVESIDGLPAAESAETLEYLYQHALQDKYRYVHRWSVGDLLLWDHIGTWHNAHADYGPTEHRLIKRCQVTADFIMNPAFVREALAA